jgi:Spy/CpxP family protein refolding chaperone
MISSNRPYRACRGNADSSALANLQYFFTFTFRLVRIMQAEPIQETSMKHIAIPTLLALVISTASFAQPYDPAGRPGGADRHRDRGAFSGPPSAERMVERLSRELELNAEQSGELLTILKTAQTEREALHQQALEEVKPELCALHLDTREQISTILSAEQNAALDEMHANRPQRRGRSGNRFGTPPDCSEFES